MNHGAKRHHRLPRRIVYVLLALIVIVVIGALIARHIYNEDLKPVSNNPSTKLVTINSGSSSGQIADLLASKHLIRSAWAFNLYIHSHELASGLQAGTYALSPSESTAEIARTLVKGKVSTDLVTILPGRRIDQVRADLINDGFSPQAVDKALKPSNYSDVQTLAYLPAGADLEGLLYPDSFAKTATTDPAQIIHESLEEMSQHLTPALQAAFAKEGLTTYQGIILASIIEQEVSTPADRAQAAQVFLTRLHSGATLGSDVTALYGAIKAGQPPSIKYDSPYNTLIHTGLPPTPISTVSNESLQAAAHPASTHWKYFVTGDNGKTYFSTTLQQHQADTKMYCHKLCGQ